MLNTRMHHPRDPSSLTHALFYPLRRQRDISDQIATYLSRLRQGKLWILIWVKTAKELVSKVFPKFVFGATLYHVHREHNSLFA